MYMYMYVRHTLTGFTEGARVVAQAIAISTNGDTTV